MGTEVVHHDNYLVALIDIVQLVKECGELFLINSAVKELNELEATPLADGCYHSGVPDTHRLARYVDILCTLTPCVTHVGMLGKHCFV